MALKKKALKVIQVVTVSFLVCWELDHHPPNEIVHGVYPNNK